MRLYIYLLVLLLVVGYLVYTNYQMAQVIREQDLLLKSKNVELSSYAQKRLRELVERGLPSNKAVQIVEKEIIKEVKIQEKCKELSDQTLKKDWGTNFKLGLQSGWHTRAIDFGIDANLFFYKRLGLNFGIMSRGLNWNVSYSLRGLWQIDNLQVFVGQIYTFTGDGRQLLFGIRLPI